MYRINQDVNFIKKLIKYLKNNMYTNISYKNKVNWIKKNNFKSLL